MRIFATAPARVLGALVVFLSCLLFAAGRADAGPYPPTACATLGVSTTTPYPNQTIEVTGTGFTAGDRVTLVLRPGPYTLGHAAVGGDGTFRTSVTIPSGVEGRHLIYADGGHPSCPVDPVTLAVQASSHAPASAGQAGQAGVAGLPFTGTNVLVMVAIALALISGGVLLNRKGARRRRRVGHAG